MLVKISSGIRADLHSFCSEALQKDGVLSGSGTFDLAERIPDLGQAHTAPEPLPDPFMIATEVCEIDSCLQPCARPTS